MSLNRLRFDRIMVMSLWPRFLAHPVDCTLAPPGKREWTIRARGDAVLCQITLK